MLNNFRKDFPLLKKQINNKPIVYFDSACMSLKPRQVIEAMNEYYRDFPVCVGRSSHTLSERATKKIQETRHLLAKFINAPSEKNIIFLRNATEGINLLANSLDLKNGDIVLTTDKEHNSNLVPWLLQIKKRGIRHQIFKLDINSHFDLDNFKKLVQGVKIVSMVHTSNLDGTTIPAKEIIKIAREQGALIILDCAQSIAHQKIDVKDLDVDFIVFSGHKMLGPTGTGVLYGKGELLEKLEPFMVGGDTVEYTTHDHYQMLKPPEKFEAGLQDYAGIIGLGEAVKYLLSMDFDAIKKHELLLNQYISQELSKIDKIKIIGPLDPNLRSSIINFYIPGKNMHQVSLMLNEMANVMVRSGQHCVHSWFNDQRIENSIRISLYFYNTLEEANIFLDNLKKIVAII